jgi:UDP-N-acetylmuramate dehydrogenase
MKLETQQLSSLRNTTLCTITEQISLHDKNWFKVGGLARFYCEPDNIESFSSAVITAKANNLELFIIGQGANILISDQGFNGLVIRPVLSSIKISTLTQDQVLVYAQAGVIFEDLINFCLQNNIIGLEEFSGIPGTVGGSVFINIHYFEFLLSQFIVEAEVVEQSTGKILTVDNSWFNFGYNTSKLHQESYYLASATFKLKRVHDTESAYAKGRSYEIIRHRHKRYPYKNTCGSFFRNFHSNELSELKSTKKLIFVAYYLDQLGVKGELSIGGAQVSHQHANMIVNTGTATAQDIATLARTMQELVLERFGILPKPECQLIGFRPYPLL